MSKLRPFLSKIKRKIFPKKKFLRADYKKTWNSVSSSENDAKGSVAGYTDELEYDRTGQLSRDMLLRTVGINPTDVVLEIGAGVGRIGKYLAPICKEWIGCDVSTNMVRHIRRRLANFKNVRAVELNGYDLGPIESASIDLVYCTVVFMHLDEWERYNYILEGMRVLKPGGRMFVDNFTLTNEHGWKFFMSTKNDYTPQNRPANISKSSTPQELEAYFTHAGFEGIQQKEENLWLFTWGTKPGK